MAVYYHKTRGIWYSTITVGNKVKYFSFPTEADARKGLELLKLELNKSKFNFGYRKYLENKGKPATISYVLHQCQQIDWTKSKRTFESAIRAFRHIGYDIHPNEITMERLDQLVVEFREEGISNGQIKIYLSNIRVTLNRAIRMRLLDSLPLFPEPRTYPMPEARDLVLEGHWIQQLMEELQAPVDRTLVFFLWKIGCRVGEALELPWSRVSFDRRRVQFIKTKGCQPRQIPMSQEVEAALTLAAKSNREGPFMNLSYTSFYKRYKAAVASACYKLKLDDQIQKEWVIHTLRHTCLTNLAQKGASAIQIKEWAGHQSLAISQRYVHSSAVGLESLAGFSSRSMVENGQPLSASDLPKSLAGE